MHETQVTVFRTLLDILYGMRAHRWLGGATRGFGAIFMLHHVRPSSDTAFAPNSFLEVTPDFLDTVIGQVREAGVDLVSLDEVHERLTGVGPERPFAAFTLDDGYRDNAEFAAPVFRRHGCPYTMYVPSDFVGGDGVLWWVVLEEAIRRSDSIEVLRAGKAETLCLRSGRSKAEAFARIYEDLRAGSDGAMAKTIRNIATQAGFQPEEIGRALCLDWTALSTLSEDPLITIGAHTRSHPILSKLDTAAARTEIADGRAMLEQRLGRKIEHFAYPVGDRASAGPRDFALVRELGFKTGVTTRRGLLYRKHAAHLEALPRVSLNGKFQHPRYVEMFLSGVPFALFNGFRQVDVR